MESRRYTEVHSPRHLQVGLVLSVTRLCAHIKVSGLDRLTSTGWAGYLVANHESYSRTRR